MTKHTELYEDLRLARRAVAGDETALSTLEGSNESGNAVFGNLTKIG
jgi:hypothetical protein